MSYRDYRRNTETGLFGKVKDFLRTTSAEIFVAAALGLATGGTLTAINEMNRTYEVPLAFSEISQIEDDAERGGWEVGPMTRFLTGTNDATMKIFECWNEAHNGLVGGDSQKNFARELEMRIDGSHKNVYRRNLDDFMESLPHYARKARESLKEFDAVLAPLGRTNTEFANSWDDSHVDHYRTETYTEEECDFEGKNCHMVTKTREVYDHTVHSYDYDRGAGERASLSIDAMLEKQPKPEMKERLRTASKTNAEGEYAAETTTLKQNGVLEDKNFAEIPGEVFLEVANTWFTGSTLRANLPVISSRWVALHNNADAWRTAKNTAHDASYQTNSRSDSGPREFQVAEHALSNGRVAHTAISEMFEGIEYVRHNAPTFDKTIREFIAVKLDNKEGAADELQDEIMETAQRMYTKNFKEGLDVDRFRWYMIFLGLFTGLAVGGAVGFAWDRAGDKFGWYRNK